MERKSFVFYRSFYEAAKNLPDNERLALFDAINEYALNGNEIHSDYSSVEALFIVIKPLLDSNTKRYENGNKGGRPRKNQAERDKAAEIIDYLNSKAGTHYRHSEASLTPIMARLQDGYTMEDCQKVIDKKAAEWRGTEFERYLRPQTLFRPSKFENYLNEKAIPKRESRTAIPLPAYMTEQKEEKKESRKATPEEIAAFEKIQKEMNSK